MLKELQNNIGLDSTCYFGIGILTMFLATISNSAFAMSPQDDLKSASNASNRFAIELHKQLASEKGNLFYSPASISSALGMTYAGAEGETRTEMGNVLQVPADVDGWMKSNGQMADMFNQKLAGFEIRLANRLWGQKNFAFNPSYLHLVEKTWNAPLGEVDYVSQSEPSRILINEWVESQTNDRIKDLLPQGVIKSDTRLVLTNAIYFKADWLAEFNKESTKDAPFFLNGSASKKVPLMYKKSHFNYFENDQLQLLSLPYKAGETSMEIILPRGKDSLGEIEGSLSVEQLAEWGKSARRREVEVFFPRFKMTSSFQLGSTLIKMGMAKAFSDSAEFGGISSQAFLKISEVVHKAFVEVDEKGTEAAAATGVIMATRAAIPQNPLVFRADRPFLMLIRHQPSGIILFIGRVSDPAPQ